MTDVQQGSRKVVGNIVMSLDGYSSGPDDGAGGMGFLLEHATSQESRVHAAGLWAGSTTALLGRSNDEGFGHYWPGVADDPAAHPLDRAFSVWLTEVEKVVLSRTLTAPTWGKDTRVSDDLAGEVERLRRTEGGDIIVPSSSSIIRSLLDADLLDELRISVVPRIVGAGGRLFEDGRPPSSWRLVVRPSSRPAPSGCTSPRPDDGAAAGFPTFVAPSAATGTGPR